MEVPTTNPYQPPSELAGERDLLRDGTEVAFRVDARQLRYATDQYLLHWHPKRLLFGSLAMIFVSFACLFGSVEYGIVSFVPTLISVMLGSAGVYSLLVLQTRRRIQHRVREHGFDKGEVMTLQFDADRCKLDHAGRTYTWPRDQIRTYRSRRGLLICPEPFLFVFVPKKSEFQAGSYNQFVKRIRSRPSTAS